MADESPTRTPHESYPEPNFYLDCLERGQVDGPRDKTTIAVIGAGMAGLVAAWLLTEGGFNVTIYEATQRVGGRVRTLREGFSSGLYAEAGAMRIPEHHLYTMELCKRFGLGTIRFPEDNDDSLVYIGNTHSRWRDYKKGEHLGKPYSSTRPPDQVFQDLMDDLGKYLDKCTREQRMALGNVSLEDYLREHTKSPGSLNDITHSKIPEGQQLTPSIIDLMSVFIGAASLKASLLENYREFGNLKSQTIKHQIIGGMDRLPRCFLGIRPELPAWIKERENPAFLLHEPGNPPAKLPDLSGKITFGARVLEIRKEGVRYGLTYEHPITHHTGNAAFDHVILAAPFSALTHVKMTTGVLDKERLRAIRSLHYENATKIILEFSHRFWEDDNIKNGGRSFTDLPIKWIYYPPAAQCPPGDRGLLLASYTWGEDSLRWGSLKPDDRIRFALRNIEELHPQRGVAEYFVSGMSHSWAGDEFTFGAFAIFDRHQESDLFENAWQPYERIHFAGEHTSYKHAWIEGAVESGIRVAMEVSDQSKR